MSIAPLPELSVSRPMHELSPRIRVLFYCNGHAQCAVCIEARVEPVPTPEHKGGDQTI